MFQCTFEKKEEDEDMSHNPYSQGARGNYDFVESCNFTLEGVNRYHLRSWSLGNGENAFWLGGPRTDGQGTKDGRDQQSSYFYFRTRYISAPWGRVIPD